MKCIIAGCRSIIGTEAYDAVVCAVSGSGWMADITEVVSGCAAGIDLAGELYAHYLKLPVKQFPAKWKTHGRSAGAIRNGEMAKYADALIAVWDGQSRGTKDMIDQATKAGLKVFVFRTDN